MLWIKLALGLLVLLVAAFIWDYRRDVAARRSGLLPPPGRATMADVRRLVRAGERLYAIRCYREIHQCNVVEARHAVEEMRRTG